MLVVAAAGFLLFCLRRRRRAAQPAFNSPSQVIPETAAGRDAKIRVDVGPLTKNAASKGLAELPLKDSQPLSSDERAELEALRKEKLASELTGSYPSVAVDNAGVPVAELYSSLPPDHFKESK